MNIQAGKNVDVNPLALINQQQDLDISSREAEIKYALSQVMNHSDQRI
ncbi:hypothetical protein MKX50_14110 [Paenibacillus sp. FSL W8-0186]